MPQTSDELRAKFPGMDTEAIDHLEGRGYILCRDWTWLMPAGLEMTERDAEALQYLVEEWDFGWIRTAKTEVIK